MSENPTSLSRQSALYREVTAQLVAAMRAGTAPWQRPWTSGPVHPSLLQLHPFNPVTGTRYRGVNRLKLSLSSIGKDCRWLTRKQIDKLGLSLRPGSRSEQIFFWFGEPKNKNKRTETERSFDETKERSRTSAGAQWHTVYNGSDVDGLDQAVGSVEIELPDFDVNMNVVNVLAASGADIVHGGDKACYAPAQDRIHLPHRQQFRSSADYDSTALHELAHWSGHPSRLGRDLGGKFGCHSYALEELHAELASVFVSVELGVGLTQRHIDQHAAYLNSWCQALESDERAVQQVAATAQNIADSLLAFAPHRVKLPGKPYQASVRRKHGDSPCKPAVS